MKDHSEVEKLEKLIGQLQGLHSELTLLAKKSPSDGVNPFKLGLVNKVIKTGNEVLGQKYLPFDDFEGFDADAVPSTSDVALVLAQYMEEAERYRSDNIKWHSSYKDSYWVYIINGDESDVRTGAPSKIGRK
jgi:hypothetical protein